MNSYDYRKLLEFSNKIDPMDRDFRDKAMAALSEEFEGVQASLTVFSDKKDSNKDSVSPLSSIKSDSSNIILLKNEQGEYIGILSIDSKKSPWLSASKKNTFIMELAKIIERALQIHMRYCKLQLSVSMLQDLLSCFPDAVILCDSNFHILFINEAAGKILELFRSEIPDDDSDHIIRSRLLPEYFKLSLKEFFVPIGEYHLHVSIQNHIIEDRLNRSYNTCCEIIIDSIDKINESKWKEYLKVNGLSCRECEISELLRLGKSNDEIAESLHISINTMKRHRESIYRKLSISRINQLNILYENYQKSYYK